jgi:hypothetical protein
LQARASVGRPFEYSHDFDENGVIYWLATGRKKSPWKNPALTGAIKIVASSIEKGKVITHHNKKQQSKRSVACRCDSECV